MINEAQIQKQTEELLYKASFSGDVLVERGINRYQVNITSPEGGLLIGQGGANILAFQHLLRLCLKRSFHESELNIYVDVNGYWRDRQNSLEQEADEAGKKALMSKEVILRPMNAHERKIVHDRLALEKGVSTESTGTGINRRIVVKKVI